jgi:hypothetical protein
MASFAFYHIIKNIIGNEYSVTSRNSTTILYIVGTEVSRHTVARVWGQFYIFVCFILLILISIYLLTAVALTPGVSSTVHIYTHTRVGDKQHRKLAYFLRFRANTKITPQFLHVNTCFTHRSLCIHAEKLTHKLWKSPNCLPEPYDSQLCQNSKVLHSSP